MFTLPNYITLLRAPLALLFLQDAPSYRCLAIILAMISDGLDGYIARKWGKTSYSGTILDPLLDKFFVFFVLIIFLREGRLEPWQAVVMVSRDFSVLLFGCYLAAMKQLKSYQYRAILCGKITTFFQFIVLFSLTMDFPIPTYFFSSFLLLGLCALGELYSFRET